MTFAASLTPKRLKSKSQQDMQDEGDGLGLELENINDDGIHGGTPQTSIYCSIVYLMTMTIVPIQVNHEEDELEMASDEEDFAVENGNFENAGIFFGDTFLNAGARDIGGLFVHRRHRSNGQCARFF